MLAGLALVLFAAARPQWGHSAQKMQARTRNVVVALDVSRSMLATDVRPNRLERAKADIADLIDSLEGDRCALVAFRRTGVLLCPLTTDHGFLRSTLESVSPESAPRGETDLGSAIRAALAALDPAADDHNAIILISDGGDLRGGARDAAHLAARRNVPVFTVGLGNPRAETAIPDASGKGSQQYQGKAVMTKLEEAALTEIAKLSGGRYVPLATAGTAETTLGAIYRRFLRQVAAKEQAEEEELRATERFGLFLVPGLLLVLLAGMLSRGRFAGRTARKVAVAACFVLCGGIHAAETNDVRRVEDNAPCQAPAALDDREVWNKGVDYYRAGDWTNALATLHPLMLSRTHGPRASEVVGAILNAEAKAALAQAKSAQGVHAEDATLAPLRRAVSAREEGAWAMQRALRAAPDDPRANRNYTRAMDGLKELRDELHVEEVLAKAKGRDPKAQMAEAAREALALLREQEGVLTNEAGMAIARSEALAKRAERLADALIPLKRTVLETVTNEQQAAEIVGEVEATRDSTLRAADQLADLSSDASLSLSTSENAFHRYWKGLLDPQDALAEAVISQSNAVSRAARVNGRDWQQEALDFTQIFGARFPEWVQKQCAQDVSTSSNEPPYTVRVARDISNAARELVKTQQALLKDPKDEDAALAIAGLTRVRDRFGLLAADLRQLVDADILMQTNAYNDVERTDGFSWQKDAFDTTRAFRARFPAWARQKEMEIQQKIQNGETNAVPFTKEQQAEVAALAAEAEKKQRLCTEKDLPPEQLDILRKLERIRELLPKDPNGGGQNNRQQQQQQNQDQNKDQDKKDDQDQQQNQDQQQDDQKDDQQQQQQEQKAQAEEPKDDKEVEELLRKAQERSDEHEADKKMRMRKAPPSPNERDW